MKKIVSIVNFLSVLGIIYFNYLAGSGQISDKTVGQISNSINSLFTPASYAFSIWGLIYFSLLVNAVWLLLKAFKNSHPGTLRQQGLWVGLANIASGFWLWFWLQEQFLISVFCMLAILICQMVPIVRLKMEKWDAPAEIIGFVWWPICLYSGWITVATVTNIAAYLKTTNFHFLLSEQGWTIVTIFIATALFLYFLYTRYMREFVAVGIWAFIAIAVRHWENYPTISFTALFAAVILLFLSLRQGFKYRKSNPFFKILKK